MTLTNNQQAYRKRKKLQSRDFKRVERSDGKVVAKVSTKRLNVRISLEAHEKLLSHSEDFGWTKRQMLNHIINTKARGKDGRTYVSHGEGFYGTTYCWDKDLIGQSSRTCRRKAGKQEKCLSLDINSTAYWCLKSFANEHNFSMARTVEMFIMSYQPVPEWKLELNRQHIQRGKEFYAARMNGEHILDPRTPEQIEADALYYRDKWDEMERERQERWDAMTEWAKQNYDWQD